MTGPPPAPLSFGWIRPSLTGLFKIKRADSFQAGHINPILFGLGPALVMCVDPALRAEIVLRLHGVELIEREQFFARSDTDVLKRR